MISKRTLEKWRRDALRSIDYKIYYGMGINGLVNYTQYMEERCLKLTQELIDQHLIKGSKK